MSKIRNVLIICVVIALVYNLQVEGDHCYRVGQQGLLVHNASSSPSNQGPTPKPVTVSNPPFLSPADYQQLSGLSFADKVVQMRGILTAVAASRTPAEITKYGQFLWVEGVGPCGEALFIGQGAPGTNYYTVTIIMRNGEVWRMQQRGILSSDLSTIPHEYTYDLQMGNGQRIVT